MRYTHQWHPDGGYTDEYSLGGSLGTVNPKVHRLVRDKIDKLSREEQLLLMNEIACMTEQAYRRGFQQGHGSMRENSIFPSKPDPMEIYDWRFAVPLEIAAFPPGTYVTRKPFDWRKDFRMQDTSINRLSIDGGNGSPLAVELSASINEPTREEFMELLVPGGRADG